MRESEFVCDNVDSLYYKLHKIRLNRSGSYIDFPKWLNCFYSYSTKEKLKKHRNVFENHDFYYVEMPEKDNKILKYNYGEKSMKVPLIIYADLESLLEKINSCHNNTEKLSTTETNKHTASRYSFFTHCLFYTTKNKLDYYRDKNCMKKICLNLKEHATKI